MNYRYILMLAVLLLPFLGGCDDDDNDSVLPDTAGLQRVKTIKGHHAHWGDFRMECFYTDRYLDSATISDASGRKTGLILSTYSKESTLDVFDLVPLEDGTKIMRRKIYSKTYMLNAMGRVSETVEHYYGPSEEAGGGADYYEEKKVVRNLFEYDAEGRMVICRCPDPLYKQMFRYEGNRLSAVDHYEFTGGEWTLAGEERYSYSNSLASAMSFTKGGREVAAWTYRWDNGRLAALDMKGGYGQGSRNYGYDAQGFVTSLSNGEDRVEVTYESGNGNFGILSSLAESFRGVPYIR